MIQSQNSAPDSPGRALLVFVQQLAHLLDRERRVFSVERLLAFTLVQKRPVLCVCATGNLFIGLRRIASTAEPFALDKRTVNCPLLAAMCFQMRGDWRGKAAN